MNTAPEPTLAHSKCAYCADALVNHRLSFIESLITFTFERYISRIAKIAPKFLEDFADWIPKALFQTLVALRLAHFSSDIDKAKTFRSRVIWEEAEKRGIKMEQIIVGSRSIEWYRAKLPSGKVIYFESLPIQPEFFKMKKNWDDKIILKKELARHSIPVPTYYCQISIFKLKSLEDIFLGLETPIIIKPQVGSLGRHTITNINTFNQFKEGLKIVRQISSHQVVEEHLNGLVCRATFVGGKLAGFFAGCRPHVIGNGFKTVQELISDKDAARQERVKPIHIDTELIDHIARAGYSLDAILPVDFYLTLSHRHGRFFGGTTREMVDELHPSFVPILEKAAAVVGLSIIGFDCIIPDPTKDASSQRWGIIECNTLPFIDLHYYALEGKPRNIAGMVWDLWEK